MQQTSMTLHNLFMSSTHALTITAICRGQEKPLEGIDPHSLVRFGLSERAGTAPVKGTANHSLEFFAALVDQGLSELSRPECRSIAESPQITVTYLTRGPVASIFRIAAEAETGIIATVARNTELNQIVEKEYLTLKQLHEVIEHSPFFQSSASASFRIPCPLGLVKGTEEKPSVYYSQQVIAHAAYIDRASYGYTSVALRDHSDQSQSIISDDLSLGAETGLDSGALRSERNKGKQVLEDLAYYLLGAATLTNQTILPNLSWGGLMINADTPPKFYLTSYETAPQDSSLAAVSQQFLALAHAVDDANAVFPRNVLVRALDRFLNTDLFRSSCIDKQALQATILASLKESWKDVLVISK